MPTRMSHVDELLHLTWVASSVDIYKQLIRPHSFQIHENAVHPYKPHQSTARICKGVLCPASCLFVPIRA